MHPPTDLSSHDTTRLCGSLIHTALIAGYTIEADALGALLPGKIPAEALTCFYKLGPPGTSHPMPDLQPWLLGSNSPFSDRFSIADGVARLIPPSMNGRAALAECFQPLETLGGLVDAVSLRFQLQDHGSGTLIYLRCNNHAPFSGNNFWMLKHLLPAITKDITHAHTQWHKQQAWDPNARLGPITHSTHSTGELLKRLSKTERLILDRLRLWETEREVALAVGRSPHTVHVHVKSIYRKLVVTNRRQLLTLVSTDKNNAAPQPDSDSISTTERGG